ncbi:MAG: hypothetical protein ABL982_18385 [Vicinamibacterales bacterium]
MAFQSQSATLSTLPFVLAGPVLRRVTPDSVTVWVALRSAADVTLVVLAPNGDRPLRGTRPTIAIGTNLHIVAVTATLETPFAPLTEGVIYRYDMSFKLSANLTHSLAGATQNAKLAYAPLTLPSFCLPPKDINTLRVIHGSCRIPHGNGPDALAILHGLITQTADNAVARPHQLLLSGDQIYADDVAVSMIVMLTDAADVLLGWQEQLPVDAGHGGPLAGNQLAPFIRRPVLEAIDFTSVDLDGHLMTFGEYLCMYLFVWSDVLWSVASIPSFADVSASVQRNTDPRVFKRWEEFLETKQKGVDAEIVNLTTFRNSLTDVRRVLANIPSYMIFDDHEVTDDWNMTRDICKVLYDDPLALQICQNALAAYAVCQHWGNVPAQFDDAIGGVPPPGTRLLRMLDGANAASYAANGSAIRRLVSVHDFATLKTRPAHGLFHEADTLTYNYTVEGPGHQVIVTDTRTWRSFPRKGGGESADLLDDSQLRAQIRDVKPDTNGRALLVILSTNAPPIQPIRSATQHPKLTNKVSHFPDLFESWELPASSTERLFNAITDRMPLVGIERRGQALMLSGDVHMGFSSRMVFKGTKRYRDPQASPQPVRAVLAQCVASSFRKQTGDTIDFHRGGYNYAPFGTKWLISQHAPEGYVGWNLKDGQKKTIGRTLFQAGSSVGEIATEITGPTTLRVSANTGGAVHFLRVSTDPDYTYRLDYLTASTQGAAPPSPVVIPPTPTGTAADRKKAAEAFNKATANYRVYNKSAATTQEIVGLNNLGEITFNWGAGDAKTANHTLRWRDPRTFLVMFTTYIVSLDPNDTAFAEIVPRLP